MKPYYSEAGIEIYCGDCREVIPALPNVDVICTDPPYGINWSRGVHPARNSKAHTGIQGDSDTSLRDEVLRLVGVTPSIVFGSFYAPFPERIKQVLVWHKPPDSGLVGSVTGFRRDAEPIFLVGEWPIKTVEQSSVLRTIRGQSGTVTETGHPHTKPLSLLRKLLMAAPSGLILDPFSGSGSTLRAAKDLGRNAIGIEIEERYCEIAAERLRQGVLQFA